MNKENSNIILQFVRHGDHDISDKSRANKDLPLLDESKKRLRVLKKTLGINSSTAVGFSGNNLRSIDTTEVLVSPDESKEILDLERDFKVKIDLNLLYKMDANFKAFKNHLGLSDAQKNIFRAVVEHSDSFKKETGYDFTSYVDLCNVITDYVLRYIEILEKWEKVSFKYDTKSLFRVFCANEYFYSCFRSKVEEVLFGEQAKEKYIAWYENNFERNEIRKHDEQSATISRDANNNILINLKDSYGEVTFSLDQLLMIKKSI